MKNGFLPMLAAGVIGGGVTAAVLLGTGAARERVTRTVVQGSALGSVASPAGASGAGPTVREIYERAAPGVALVRARSLQSGASSMDLSERSEAGVASAAAFVIDREGRLLTNAHAVTGATDIRVTLPGGRTVPARVLGKDEDTDLALLGVEPEGLDLRPLELGSSRAVQVGDPTVSIGNPYGSGRTLTTGVVSAKQRRLTAPSGFSVDNVIQTDGVLTPGTAGGPLLDSAGRVIGVNSQIEADAPHSGAGLGFAVPIDTAKALMPSLQAHRSVTHAYLGVWSGEAPEALVSLGSGKTGVRVGEVDPDGPAARAGILGDGSVAGGDVLLAVDGQPVRSMADVDDVLSRHRPGDGIPVELWRDGARLTVQVQLSERPASVPLG